MVTPVNSNAFLFGFQAYLLSREISQEDISILIAAYKEIELDAALSQQLLAKSPKEIGENISLPSLLYIYLNAILNGDIERAEAYLHNSALNQVEDDELYYQYTRMRMALAYDFETNTFTTDNLLTTLAKLTSNKGFEYYFRVSELFSPEISPCFGAHLSNFVLNDYRIDTAINLIKAVLAENAEYLLPQMLKLIFSYHIQDDKTYNFGLFLLTKYVEPEEILNHASRPSNNDYRLLNHCVELLVQKNPGIDFNGISRKCNPAIHNCLLHDIPAALFLCNNKESDIKAAKLGYKPAMARCIVRGYPYVESISDGLDDVLALWQEKYLSTYQTLSAIAIFGVKHDERDLGDYSDIDYVYGLSFKPAVDIPCLGQRMTLLSNVCEANRLALLSHRIREKKNDEFPVLYQTAKSLLKLRKSKYKNLQAWLDIPFGHLIITCYSLHCLKLETLAEVRKFAEKVVDHLVLCNPHWISLWQLELLYKHLSDAMSLDKEVADAYEDFKSTLKEIQNKKCEVTALATSMDVVRLMLKSWSIVDLLRWRVRGVNKHFRWVVDERLLIFLNNAPQFPDYQRIKRLNHIFYIACQSGNLLFMDAALRYIKKETFSDAYRIAVYAGQLDSVKLLEEKRLSFSLNESERTSSHLGGLHYGHAHVVEYFLRQASYRPDFRYELGLYVSACYFNALLSQRMTKEKHQQWLTVIQKKLLDNSKDEIKFVFHVAILCEDWQLLRMLLRYNAKCFHLLAEEDTAKSVMLGLSYAVTASAPKWWQDEQYECLEQLKIEKQQWIKLCQALLQALETSLMRPLQSITILFANNYADRTRKFFISDLRTLIKRLSENKIDVSSAIALLAVTIENFRDLEQINTFFNLPAKCSFVELVQCIENCLQRYTSAELSLPASAKRNENTYSHLPVIGLFGDWLDRIDRINPVAPLDPHRLAPPAPLQAPGTEEETQPAKMPAMSS